MAQVRLKLFNHLLRKIMKTCTGLVICPFFLYRHRLLDAYGRDFWEAARKTLAALWDAQGNIEN